MIDLIGSDIAAAEVYKMGLKQKIGTYFNFSQQLSKFFVYNRVEGLSLNYGLSLSNLLLNNSIISLKGGYGFKDRQWKGEANFLCFIDNSNNFFWETNIFKRLDYQESPNTISTFSNSIISLLNKADYRDYFCSKGIATGLGIRATEKLAIKLVIFSQQEKSAVNHTRFSLLKYKQKFRPNPEILPGKINAFRASLIWKAYNFESDITCEFTDKKYFDSDFDYTWLKANMLKNFRITENTYLFFSAAGGLSSGFLPPQRWFDFGGKVFLNYHGNLRGVNYNQFTGDKMIYSTFEYVINGNAFPFAPRLLKNLKISLWNGIGWSSLFSKNLKYAIGISAPTTTTDGVYYEYGIGIGDKLNILRIDFLRTSSGNKIGVNFNILH